MTLLDSKNIGYFGRLSNLYKLVEIRHLRLSNGLNKIHKKCRPKAVGMGQWHLSIAPCSIKYIDYQ